MLRRLLLTAFFLAALVAAPAAAGDGPMPTVTQDGGGIVADGGGMRIVALPASQERTVIAAVSTKDGAIRRSIDYLGAWGLPRVDYNGSTEGLSADGKTLVLGDVPIEYPRKVSKFLVLNARTLGMRSWIVLKGDFAYDALSPDGSRLYLIQHLDPNDSTRYVVRSYDVATDRLLPGRIADRTQKGWVMRGYPITRATSSDGRMVYTLYQNPGGFPFVHALDTVRGVAHCVGFRMQSQNAIFNLVLGLHGKTLAIGWRSGRPFYAIDTTTWRVSRVQPAFPWLWAGAGSAVPLALVGAVLLRRRRRGRELDEELADLLHGRERELVH